MCDSVAQTQCCGHAVRYAVILAKACHRSRTHPTWTAPLLSRGCQGLGFRVSWTPAAPRAPSSDETSSFRDAVFIVVCRTTRWATPTFSDLHTPASDRSFAKTHHVFVPTASNREVGYLQHGDDILVHVWERAAFRTGRHVQRQGFAGGTAPLGPSLARRLRAGGYSRVAVTSCTIAGGSPSLARCVSSPSKRFQILDSSCFPPLLGVTSHADLGFARQRQPNRGFGDCREPDPAHTWCLRLVVLLV